MSNHSDDRQTHWQNVYRTKGAASVSWYRPHLEVSLELLSDAGMAANSRVIDVGGGASTLVDDLLDRGLRDVSVLDVSEEALALTRARLGERAKAVTWYAGDVLDVRLPPGGFDFWHDRAVLHFLTDAADAARYVGIAANAVALGGHAVIAGFALDGPERCSGLTVVRRSAEDIAALFGPAFTLERKRGERHRTPAGIEQSFAYALLKRARPEFGANRSEVARSSGSALASGQRGCHLNWPIETIIAGGGFQVDHLETGYMSGPKPMTFMYEGAARPH